MKVKSRSTQINILQKDVSKIAKEIEENPDLFYEISKYNKKVGYFISAKMGDQFLDYLEEVDMMNDRDFIRSLKQAKDDYDQGKNYQNLDSVLEDIED